MVFDKAVCFVEDLVYLVVEHSVVFDVGFCDLVNLLQFHVFNLLRQIFLFDLWQFQILFTLHKSIICSSLYLLKHLIIINTVSH